MGFKLGKLQGKLVKCLVVKVELCFRILKVKISFTRILRFLGIRIVYLRGGNARLLMIKARLWH